MNKKIIWIVVIIIVLAIVWYITTSVKNQDVSNVNETIPPVATSTTPTPTPISTDSGITGTVTIGPTCAGPTRPGCEDKPYSATFNLYSKAGPGDGVETLINTLKSDSNGKFTINLSPGNYEIRQANKSGLPSMSPQSVVVKANTFSHLNIQFDSGIR